METVIDATIVVSQESQKGMVIGKGGAKIKEVGIKARVVSDSVGVEHIRRGTGPGVSRASALVKNE